VPDLLDVSSSKRTILLKKYDMHGRPRKCQAVFQRRFEGKIAAMHSDLMQVGSLRSRME
jgi:hypothetical protein